MSVNQDALIASMLRRDITVGVAVVINEGSGGRL